MLLRRLFVDGVGYVVLYVTVVLLNFSFDFFLHAFGFHLFIINGDLSKIACDALLVPTDERFTIEQPWRALLHEQRHEIPKQWGGERVVALPVRRKEPRIWLGNAGRTGDSSGFSAFAPIVQDFVVKAGAEVRAVEDSERIYPWPKPRLAVNVVEC